MRLLAGHMHLPPVPANLLAIGAMSGVNYLIGDRWVFRSALPEGGAIRESNCEMNPWLPTTGSDFASLASIFLKTHRLGLQLAGGKNPWDLQKGLTLQSAGIARKTWRPLQRVNTMGVLVPVGP